MRPKGMEGLAPFSAREVKSSSSRGKREREREREREKEEYSSAEGQ